MSDIIQSPEAQEYVALLQFLYMAPVGLVQLATDGTILMLNPLSAQLLMPLSRDGELTNLFDALAPVAPDLQLLCSTWLPNKLNRPTLRGQFTFGVCSLNPGIQLSLNVNLSDTGRLLRHSNIFHHRLAGTASPFFQF